MDIVDRTLHLWRTTPFIWGEDDCMLSVAKYIAERGGKDVVDLFRGQYDSEEAAKRVIRDNGGASGLAALTEIEPWPDEPERGDVVAIGLENDTIAGICTGDMIAVRLVRGVGEIRTKLVNIEGAWRCPH